jgi:hypothetical protein
LIPPIVWATSLDHRARVAELGYYTVPAGQFSAKSQRVNAAKSPGNNGKLYITQVIFTPE